MKQDKRKEMSAAQEIKQYKNNKQNEKRYNTTQLISFRQKTLGETMRFFFSI